MKKGDKISCHSTKKAATAARKKANDSGKKAHVKKEGKRYCVVYQGKSKK
jgi:hypothetical protein